MSKKTLIITAILFSSIALLAAAFFLVNPFKTGKTGSEKNARPVFPDSFAFYHLESNTILADNFTRNFNQLFGPHAVTRKTTLDLEIRGRDVLAGKFDALNRLDKNLNGRANERIEHDTTLLTFRYPPPETKFFHHVRLWFSNHNLKPLLVEIRTDQNGKTLIDAITSTYGPGKEVKLETTTEKLLYWEKEKDYLLVFKTPDRYGSDIYVIKIYYVNNLETLNLKKQQNQESPAKPVFF